MTALALRQAEAELNPETTVAKSATVQCEGEREVTRDVEYWATQWLREYIVKSFTPDDEQLRCGYGGNDFHEGQLDRSAVVARHATTVEDGKTYEVEYDNLDAIISVGCRVTSHRSAQSRISATQRLLDMVLQSHFLVGKIVT